MILGSENFIFKFSQKSVYDNRIKNDINKILLHCEFGFELRRYWNQISTEEGYPLILPHRNFR